MAERQTDVATAIAHAIVNSHPFIFKVLTPGENVAWVLNRNRKAHGLSVVKCTMNKLESACFLWIQAGPRSIWVAADAPVALQVAGIGAVGFAGDIESASPRAKPDVARLHGTVIGQLKALWHLLHGLAGPVAVAGVVGVAQRPDEANLINPLAAASHGPLVMIRTNLTAIKNVRNGRRCHGQADRNFLGIGCRVFGCKSGEGLAEQ